ncbi:hypothetical protein [Deinococcus hopiensis]|uniref:hypothetical protein n=1 Tax=Deinococcus hopiensis TaxID=309885 RepID=UPI0014837A79
MEDGEGLPEAAVREFCGEVELPVRPVDLSALGVRWYRMDGARGTDFPSTARSSKGAPQLLRKTSEVEWICSREVARRGVALAIRRAGGPTAR